MSMAHVYDQIVIGSSTAAQVVSHRMAATGWKLAVINHRPFGGTCALRGCDPKKVLLTGAEDVINLFGFVIRHGLTATGLRTKTFAYPTGASDTRYML